MTGCWLPSARTPPRRRVRDSLDLAQVGLEFSTSGLARGETAALSTFTRVEQGAQRAQAATAGLGPVFQHVAQETQKAGQANQATAAQVEFLRKALEQQGFTAKQVAQQIAAMDASLVVVPAHFDAVAESAHGCHKALDETGAALTHTGTVAGQSTMHVGRLGFAMTSLANQTAQVPPIVGHLSYSLASMTSGALAATGIIAGFAIIAASYKQITAAATEAEERIQKVIDRLREQRAEQERTAVSELRVAEARLASIPAEIARAQAKLADAQGVAGFLVTAVGRLPEARLQVERTEQLRINALLKEQTELEKDIAQAKRNVGEATRETHEREVRSVVEVINLGKAGAAVLARRAELIREAEGELLRLGPPVLQNLYARNRLETEINALREAGSNALREQLKLEEQWAQSAAGLAIAAASAVLKQRQDAYNAAVEETLKVLPMLQDWQGRVTDAEREYQAAVTNSKHAIAEARLEAERRAALLQIETSDLLPENKDALEALIQKHFEVKAATQGATEANEAWAKSLEGMAKKRKEMEDASAKAAADIATEQARQIQEVGKAAAAVFADLFSFIIVVGEQSLERFTRSALRHFAQLGAQLPFLMNPPTPENKATGAKATPGGFGVVGNLGVVAAVTVFTAGLTSFLDDMINGAERAREAAEKMRQAREQWEQVLSDFTAIWSPRGALGDALEQLRRQYEAAKNQGAFGAVGFESKARADYIAQKYANQPLTGGTYDFLIVAGQKYREELKRLEEEYEKAKKATEERIALERQRRTEDTQVEILRLQGQTSQADTLALQLQQARQLQEFIASIGSDPWTEADKAFLVLLGTLHELQAAALLAAQAEEELRKARQREDISGGFAVRGLRLAGDTTGAGVLQAQIDFGLGLRELDDWLKAGFITVEQYAEYQAILNGEMAKTIDAINAEVAARAEAIVAFNRTLTDELALRDLQNLAIISGAKADQEAYEDAARAAQHKREVDEAVANGATEATLAAIAYSQALDDQAVAAMRAANAAAEAARAMEQISNIMDDLAVQALWAAGLDAASQDLAQRLRDQQVINDLLTSGATQEQIDWARGVQAAVQRRKDDERRAAQQAAFDQAFPTTSASTIAASQTRVDLAVGASESGVHRVAAILESAMIYWRHLETIDSGIQTLVVIARRGGGLVAIDSGLGQMGSEADRVSGVPPGNR